LRQAIEDNLANGVNAMKRCMHLKVRAKNLLRAIDQGNAEKETQLKDAKHRGTVKEEIFWETLDMLKIKLKDGDKTVLRVKYGSEGKLKYKEALAVLTVNTLAEKPLEEVWVVRAGPGEDADKKTSLSIREFLESRVDAASSYQSTSFSSKISS
jgi:hypothetical protein